MDSISLPPPLGVRSSNLSPGDAPAAPGPAAPRGNLRASKVAEKKKLRVAMLWEISGEHTILYLFLYIPCNTLFNYLILAQWAPNSFYVCRQDIAGWSLKNRNRKTESTD